MNSIQEVMTFLEECVDYIGLGFHPDNDFADYINPNTRETLYAPEQAEYYNQLMCEAFDICEEYNLDIYELTLNLI